MRKFGIPIYKKVPVLRLLIPLIVGILLQYYLPIEVFYPCVVIGLLLIMLVLFRYISLTKRYQLQWIRGLSIILIYVQLGMILLHFSTTANSPNFIGRVYNKQAPVLVYINQPIEAKANSYKVDATFKKIFINNQWKNIQGKLIIYFKKDTIAPPLSYGDELLFNAPLQLIKNSGNPGAFDYKAYSAMHGIYYQVFLKNNQYVKLKANRAEFAKQQLLQLQNWVLQMLKTNIRTDKELAIAEALLIGYRNDLDRDLVQAYSNTGVVHIIAISGLHVGLIYSLLLWLFKHFKQNKVIRVVKPIVIVSIIWIFTLLAGAAPSILRSAIMFTFMVIGDNIGRKSNIFNTLAVSALVIIILNPYALWDVGFQLSYAAVLSILIFSKPIEKLLLFNNQSILYLWKLIAITVSAQILTSPLIFYHFHQFPTLFFTANLVAVPLSSAILFGEILLLLVGLMNDYLALKLGWLIEQFIHFLNYYIFKVNKVPFSVISYIKVSVWQVVILYALVATIYYWLKNKNTRWLIASLTCMLAIVVLRSIDFYQKSRQRTLVVYNVPRKTAIDVVSGFNYQFIGDIELVKDGFLRNFHLQPARVNHRLYFINKFLLTNWHGLQLTNPHKQVAFIQKPIAQMASTTKKQQVDIIVISNNPSLSINHITTIYDCKKYVFDSSNPMWKIKKWKKECEELHLQYHSTQEHGAFVYTL